MERQILLLDRHDVRHVLDWSALLDTTRTALVDLATSGTAGTISTQLLVPTASLHVKGGAVADPPAIALKANLRPDAGSSDGAILVFDYEREVLRAVIASADITTMRTAAIAGLAANALQVGAAATVALIGAGPVATRVDQVLGHLGVGRELRVWSRTTRHASTLVEREQDGVPRRRVSTAVAEAVAGADLVITCTPSREPLVTREGLGASVRILAMGADTAGKRELDAGVLSDATLLADVPEDARRVGEFAYLPASLADQVASLGALLSAPFPSRIEGRIIVDSVGSAAVDAAVCALVLERAMTAGRGKWLDF
jgi:ornithine cyclodeaminase/alanine dehydrogenase-like protein (mu-crystallin family)